MKRIGVVSTLLVVLGVAHGARAGSSYAPGERLEVEAPGADGKSLAVGIHEGTPMVAKAAGALSPTIYLNRCKGGCVITKAPYPDNAGAQQSWLPNVPDGQTVMVTEWSWDDPTWANVVQCVKEVYSPFNVQVTDVAPGPGVIFHEAIVAGLSSDLSLGANVGGVGPLETPNCTPKDNAISFTFANGYAPQNWQTICAVVAQETAHAFGLDHEYSCTDPMTYLPQCGGQQFFRNHEFPCGRFAVEPCLCDASMATQTQNSHARILASFGPGTSIVPGPTVSLLTPASGDTVQNKFLVDLSSTARRGTFKVNLKLNGYTWVTQDVPVDRVGNDKPAIYAGTYAINVPDGVPDGVIDIEAEACDDLDQCASAKATVTKGAPCADATTCAKGQKCETGKCFWDAATGEVGDACDYPQACKSGICFGAAGASTCTQTCFTGIAGQCPDGFSCQLDSTQQGHCLTAADGGGGGCCSAADESAGATLARAGLAGAVMLLVFGRRRRRGARA